MDEMSDRDPLEEDKRDELESMKNSPEKKRLIAQLKSKLKIISPKKLANLQAEGAEN